MSECYIFAFDCYYSHHRWLYISPGDLSVAFLVLRAHLVKSCEDEKKMERGIENVRGEYHEGVARVGCILSGMRSRRSLHSDVQHESRGDRENG